MLKPGLAVAFYPGLLSPYGGRGCVSTELITFARGAVPAPATPSVRVPEAIAEWDDNRNGRVSCAEARSHGIADGY